MQEEVIFRGLVQSFLQARWSEALAVCGTQVAPAVICTAVLFAIVHLGSGLATVVGALALSILEWRLLPLQKAEIISAMAFCRL
jgi:membrane protease YdiL (CAAX protease family)